eukprot:CAMPEP_0114978578 /NCGR_PEP_ID=MMETSP0216-20121206/3886_1 /TAXON_ID=223996 /ORGANISM="Protocruzia adherens, Strain Boccale" /LENGTH=544 /DNA_ID=CAMNT_0002339793 /DNA_START=121 /DNA_END=1755 /DNA_ORIENTATION=+
MNLDPSVVPLPATQEIRSELRYSVQYLSTNKLYTSAKWVGELLAGLASEREETKTPSVGDVPGYVEKTSTATDKLHLARILFDLKEFNKAAFVLKEFAKPVHQEALFLHHYSLFLAAEQKKEEEIIENGDSLSRTTIMNRELNNIKTDLGKLYEEDRLNELNLYLYGIVLKETGQKDAAKQAFIKSINAYPLIWSVWVDLCGILDKNDKNLVLSLKDHWMKNFFIANYYLEMQLEAESLFINNILLQTFPDSLYIFDQIAQASYNNQEFDTAMDHFKHISTVDPYRYENTDSYSNILYIKEDAGELSYLAYKTFNNDKYRPETCCVVGNYYSLKGEHEKAIMYFKRAIKLDRNFLSAWTLMGHEYLETKNAPAAIEAYRTAVDVNPNDYRAWYGLGQTYELYLMHNYALHYFTNAALSRPNDSRMWNALAKCYERLNNTVEAKYCNERAELHHDREGIVLHQLAKIYLTLKMESKAADCFRINLERKDSEKIEGQEKIDALLFLSKFYMKHGDYEKTKEYAMRLHDYNGAEREEVRAILREISE